MKKLILLSGLMLFILACSKEDDEPQGFPWRGFLSFEMLNEDGSIPEDDSILMSQYLILENGVLTTPSGNQNNIIWNNLGKILSKSTIVEKSLFGIPCPLSCEDEYIEIEFSLGSENFPEETNNPISYDFYSLIKYLDKRKDTLRINTYETFNPYTRKITIYVNEKEKLIKSTSGNPSGSDIFITIQKND